jgi:hypothetical protein
MPHAAGYLPQNNNVSVYQSTSFEVNQDSIGSVNQSTSPGSRDSGYHSDLSNCSNQGQFNSVAAPVDGSYNKQHFSKSNPLNSKALQLLEAWYLDNTDRPYATKHIVDLIAKLGDITAGQVRKWLANKRVRTLNTGTKGRKIQQKQMTKSNARHHPYASATGCKATPANISPTRHLVSSGETEQTQPTSVKVSPTRPTAELPSSTSTSPASQPGMPVINGQQFYMTPWGVKLAIQPTSP